MMIPTRTPTKRQPDAPRVPRRRPWLALSVLMLPVLLISVDNTVLAFAVPQLSTHLQPTSAQLLWMVDIYPLILAALLVPMGAMADKYGRRRLLLIGGAGFAVVSAAAAFAPSAGYLIGARAGMAIFGATLMPSTLSLLRNIFTNPKQRRLAIAIWAAGFSAGAALGPIVGGFLLEHFNWGSIFLMAVPILVPFLILAPFLVPESKDPNPGRIDLPSVLLVVLTMAPIVFGITELATGGGVVLGLGAIVSGLVFGSVFVLRQVNVASPLLDMQLFKNPVFRGSVIINLLSVFSLVGFIFFVTQDLQLVMGMDPLAAAFALVPGLAATVLAGLLVVPVVARVRPAIVVLVNFTLAAIGYSLVAFTETNPGIVMIAFVVLGIGIGAGETVSNDLILSNAPPHQAGSASAISETAYEVGAALGTAVIGGFITAHFRRAFELPAGLLAGGGRGAAASVSGGAADGVGVVTAADIAGADTLGGAVALSEKVGGSVGAQILQSAQDAFASSAVVTASVGAVLMLSAAIYAGIALRGARS